MVLVSFENRECFLDIQKSIWNTSSKYKEFFSFKYEYEYQKSSQ